MLVYVIILNDGISFFRFDISCTTTQPTGRAGHASAFDDKRNLVWIFGGYSTYFPYLSTDGIGSGMIEAMQLPYDSKEVPEAYINTITSN